jgi:hypothetical protein
VHIGVVLESTRFSAHDCRAAVAAVAHQLRYDVAPAWDRHVPSIAVYANPEAVPDGAHVVVIVDDADVAGALGYHDETPDGRPYARVFVSPVLDNGGTALNGSLSVSAVLSHEVVELMLDPNVSTWCDNWPRNESVALEGCDPCEANSYQVMTRYGWVSVSDFVWPAYFDAQAAPHSFFTQKGSITKPFGIAPGGYLLVRSEGTVTQRWGPGEYDHNRVQPKEHHASRTWLRRNFVAGGGG